MELNFSKYGDIYEAAFTASGPFSVSVTFSKNSNNRLVIKEETDGRRSVISSYSLLGKKFKDDFAFDVYPKQIVLISTVETSAEVIISEVVAPDSPGLQQLANKVAEQGEKISNNAKAIEEQGKTVSANTKAIEEQGKTVSANAKALTEQKTQMDKIEGMYNSNTALIKQQSETLAQQQKVVDEQAELLDEFSRTTFLVANYTPKE